MHGSRRTERIASRIRTVLGDAILHRLGDPRIEPLTSIVRVEVSQDLSLARVHVSILAPEARRQLGLRALQRAAPRLRSYLAPELNTRIIPRIEFRLDETLRRSIETVQAIDRAMAEHLPATASDAPQENSGE